MSYWFARVFTYSKQFSFFEWCDSLLSSIFLICFLINHSRILNIHFRPFIVAAMTKVGGKSFASNFFPVTSFPPFRRDGLLRKGSTSWKKKKEESGIRTRDIELLARSFTLMTENTIRRIQRRSWIRRIALSWITSDDHWPNPCLSKTSAVLGCVDSKKLHKSNEPGEVLIS